MAIIYLFHVSIKSKEIEVRLAGCTDVLLLLVHRFHRRLRVEQVEVSTHVRRLDFDWLWFELLQIKNVDFRPNYIKNQSQCKKTLSGLYIHNYACPNKLSF